MIESILMFPSYRFQLYRARWNEKQQECIGKLTAQVSIIDPISSLGARQKKLHRLRSRRACPFCRQI